MPESPEVQQLKNVLVDAALQAGKAILEVYESDFAVQTKDDKSPLTEADTRSHNIIMPILENAFPGIPVLSEEGLQMDYAERRDWDAFFLVDPLDGTKEFIKRNGQFAVLIAYLENNRPIFGVVTAPAAGMATYFGGRGIGSFRVVNRREEPIRTRKPESGEPLTIVESASHASPELAEYLSTINVGTRIAAGSGLKFCRVAEGEAHLYPRLGPTMEWDTAAGQAVLEGAGGSLTKLDGSYFAYNKEDLRNPGFLAKA